MTGDRFVAPATLEEAWEVLEEDTPRVRILGGGTWVVPALQQPHRSVTVLSLRRLPLSGVRVADGVVSVGAMTNYDTLIHELSVREDGELLHCMAGGITGGRQIRLQATVGGAAAAARPQSDVPGALATLSARVVLASSRGLRRLTCRDFFLDAFHCAADDDEILTAVEFDAAPRSGHGYVKLKGAAGSWPIVTAGARVAVSAEGTIETAEVGIGGATPTPLHLDLTGELAGTAGSDGELADCARDCVRITAREAWEDEHAPGDYRAAVSPVAVRRALKSAIESATRKART